MHEVKQNESGLPAAEPGLLMAGLDFAHLLSAERLIGVLLPLPVMINC